MKAYGQRVLRSSVMATFAMGGAFAMDTSEAVAKTSVLYCGSPQSCSPFLYKPHGGRADICAQHSPCYLSPDCTGPQACQSQPSPQPN